MPLWGIVLLGLVVWVLISVVIGAVIGRAVRIADAHRRDQVLVHQLGKRGVPQATPSWGPVTEIERPAAHAARKGAPVQDGRTAVPSRLAAQ